MLSVAYGSVSRTSGGVWLAALVALAVVAALSSLRLVAAPGFEFYLGPLFYLLAYRWFGLRAGLVTAVVAMVPTVFWWGHPLSLLLALGHVLVVHRIARQHATLAPITLFYQITIGAAVAMALFVLHMGMTFDVVVVGLLRKVLCEVVLAATADLIALVIVVNPARGTVGWAKQAGLQESTEVIVSMALAGMALLFLVGQLHHIRDRLELSDREADLVVAMLQSQRQIASGSPFVLNLPGIDAALPAVAVRPGTMTDTLKLVGCKRADAGGSGPNDHETIVYWMEMCFVLPLDDGRYLLLAPQPLVHQLFRELIHITAPLVLFLALAQICLIAFGSVFRRSTQIWDEALAGFGRQELLAVRHSPFREMDELLHAYTRANNAFVSAERERAQLSLAVDELRSVISLKLLGNIRFDRDQHKLRYVLTSPKSGNRKGSLAIHAGDTPQFVRSAGKDDVTIEFRTAGGSDDKWFLLLARDYDQTTGYWRSGCLIHLRTAKAYQSRMRHNARLMELGGMASALSHEMRQPLATISLAAENGKLMLAQPDACPDRIATKFERIVEQVERANAIVQRTSGYARSGADERMTTDLQQTVIDVARFMRPVMNECGIELAIDTAANVPMLQLPTVGIEQILVNALQNAADSVEARQAEQPDTTGTICVTMTMEPGCVIMKIRDNGAGVSDDIRNQAFKAFCTSKPAGKGTGLGLFVCRQIMDEIGGSIALANNEDAPGATLTLCFPVPDRG